MTVTAAENALLERRAPTFAVEGARPGDLPLFEGEELEVTSGYGRWVRLAVAMPLGLLGGLAFSAALVAGQLVFAALVTIVIAMCFYSLWDDTRLTNALDQLRRGHLHAAQVELEKVASAGHRSTLQRQRAQGHLATIAWHEGDLVTALRWTRERLRGLLAARGPSRERSLTRASEIQLLALLGRSDEAAAALARSGSPLLGSPSIDARTRLLVAFASDDPESIRRDLPIASRSLSGDCTGVGTALLAWAFAGVGERDRAMLLVHEVQSRSDREHLQRHFPRLLQWIDGYAATHRYG